MLVSAFEAALRPLGLLDDQDPIVVALSGGLDSMVLLDVAVERLGARRVIAAHVDHAVRPESAAQAETVARLVVALGVVAFELERLPPGPADEARLRRERYRALERIRRARGAGAILVAHTEDDQAETVLLDLVRGGRGSALRGMPAVRGHVVRPFLTVPRAAVHAWAGRRRLGFVQDPSNHEPSYLRNRIRKELLPLIEARYRPRFAHRLARRATEAEPEPRGLAGGWNRGGLPRVAPSDELAIQLEWRPAPAPLPGDLWGCVVDATRCPQPRVRLARAGDRIRLLGLEGHKKLQDVFVDAKVSRERRARYPVLLHEGEIVWVPGLARSPIGLVGPETGPVWVAEAGPERLSTCGPSPSESV